MQNIEGTLVRSTLYIFRPSCIPIAKGMQTWYVSGTTNRVSREVPRFPKTEDVDWTKYAMRIKIRSPRGEFFLFSLPLLFSFSHLLWDERIPAIDW